MSGNLLYNLGDRLYTNRPGTTELEPQLATDLPTVSDDGLTYTIPLREGVVFHDGSAFNAEAMAFSLQRFVENGGTPAYLLSSIVDRVEASGEYELTIVLKQPFAAFPTVLAFTGLAAVAPNAYTIGENQFKPDSFVGTGPYTLTEFGPDVIRLEPFGDYWGEAPQNQGIDIQVYSSAANLFNALRTGEVDVAYQSLDPEQISTLETQAAQNQIQMMTSAGNGIHYLSMNVLGETINQLPVRQALAAAIDRSLLSERVFQNQVQPLYSLVPSNIAGQVPVFESVYGDGTSGDRAKSFLTAAGFSADKPAIVDLWYRSNLNSNSLAANTIKAMVDDRLGGLMVINLQGVESTTAYDNLEKGIYPVFMLDWSPDFLDADNYLEPFLACETGSPDKGCTAGASQYQGSFYYNPQVQDLIQAERAEKDSQKRLELLAQLQTIVANDVPFIPLWENKAYAFAQTTVQGVNLQPTQHLTFSTLAK